MKKEELLNPGERLDDLQIKGNLSVSELEQFFTKILGYALEIRDQESSSQSGHVLKQALDYIDEHFEKYLIFKSNLLYCSAIVCKRLL